MELRGKIKENNACSYRERLMETRDTSLVTWDYIFTWKNHFFPLCLFQEEATSFFIHKKREEAEVTSECTWRGQRQGPRTYNWTTVS